MSSADAIWDDFRLDDNCVRVEGENKTRVYFAQIRRALAGLRNAATREESVTNAERRAVALFLGRLQRTFEMLALRHFFSGAGPALKIDTTDSGFVHFSVLLELAADLEGRDAELATLEGPEEIKRRMLDEILQGLRRPHELQAALMRRLYLESLDAEALFRAFLSGPLEKVGRGDDASSYFWSFATYDRALNRPFVTLVYFAWNGGRKTLSAESPEFAEIHAAAEQAASGRTSLLAFSNRLDERVERMSPRIVKRLVLGPYRAPGFTRDEDGFGSFLESLADRLPFALRWETETLVSERETRVGGGWLSKGQLRQVFWVPRDLDLTTRGVSRFERFVLLPHWLAQQVRAAGHLPDHRHVILGADERVHGLD